MRYTKKQFFADVTAEIEALKKYATKEEIKKLNFENFNPDNVFRCIYGQMTGDCTEKRASELIYKCCPRLIRNPCSKHAVKKGMITVASHANGKVQDEFKTEEAFCEHRACSLSYYSAIEMYILIPFAKPKNLIDYIKGERKELVL